MGVNFEEITQWSTLFKMFIEAAKNPVIVVSVAVSVWNLITDPTTPGICDSARALSYVKPGVTKEND